VTSTSPDTRAISWLSSLAARLNAWQRAAGYGLALAAAAAGGLAFGLWGTDRPDPGTIESPSPGALTAWGLPISQLAVMVSAVGTIGMLATAILLPREDGRLGAVARRCLGSAALLALGWALAVAALLVFSWSDFAHIPVTRAAVGQIFGGANPYPNAMPYLFAAILAVIVAGAAYITRTVLGAVVVWLLAAYNVLPLTTRGHDVGGLLIGVAVTVHVLAVAVWVGGLAGLLIHVRRSPALLAVAVPRFGRLALACFVIVGVFGLTAAWVNLGGPGELGTTHYGTLVIYKVEALAALGIFEWWHRRRTIPPVVRQTSRHGFIRFAALEVVVMTAAIALGVALSRTPAPAAPAPVTPSPSPYTGVMAPLHPGHVQAPPGRL
jgi:putative copper resistance protein D